MPIANVIALLIWGVVTVGGLGLTVLGAAALITYIRRTSQLRRSEEDGSVQVQMLDELQQLGIQLSLLNERMERIEHRLPIGDELPALPDTAEGETLERGL